MFKEPQSQTLFRKKIYYTESARSGFAAILRMLEFGEEEKILIPAYIGINDKEGSGVFDPICEEKVKYDFYELNERLKIKDLEVFARQLKSPEVKAVLLIHYFGFCPNDIDEVLRICQEACVVLIEDCAHTVSSSYKGKRLGDHGDFSFFSLHKYLPVSLGGCFRVNTADYPGTEEDFNDYKELENSQILMTLLRSDFEAIKAKRLENYRLMASLLKDNRDLEVMYPNPVNGIVPLNMPVLIKHGLREPLYFELERRGVPTVALYYRLIEQIDREKFPVSYHISQNILNLLTHQDITCDDIYRTVNTLNEALNKLRK